MIARCTRVILLCSVVLLQGVAQADQAGRHAAGVASAHPLATAAGQEILAAGGNAFDAAVAVSAALSVVEPYSSGLGGGGIYLLYAADTGTYQFVDARETAPAAATADMYLDTAGEPVPGLSRNGPLAGGIPGVPAALGHLAGRYGRLPLDVLLQPAIRHAREGFAVDERFLQGVAYKKELLRKSPAASEVFLVDGAVPQEDAVIRQPDLAQTLERLARDGVDGYYRGETAQRLVSGVRAGGGIWTHEDLENYRVIEREPLTGEYRGMKIITAPPPSAGGVALLNMLNILEPYDLGRLAGAQDSHLIVEAMRRAFRDRAQYLGDADFVEVPVAMLTHPFYAAGQRASIRLDRATPSGSLPGFLPEGADGMHTTHFSVLDAEGNRVAGTQTINTWFGSGFMAPGTGVLVNNEMDDFSIKPGVPNAYELVGAAANAIAPGKRPLSSMTPTFVEADHGLAILGTPGGSRIISMVLLGVLTFADGGDAQDIVAAPRFHHQYLPDRISYEPEAFSPGEIGSLQALGHTLQESGRRYGNMNAITWRRTTGEVQAGADPRGYGAASTHVY